MRFVVLLLLIALVAFLFGAGIIYVTHGPGSVSVTVDKDKLNRDTQDIQAKAQELGRKVSADAKRATDEVRQDLHNNTVPPTVNPGPTTPNSQPPVTEQKTTTTVEKSTTITP